MNTQPLLQSEGSFRQKASSQDSRRDILSRVVEAEIIPRLLMVHRLTDAHANVAARSTPPTPAEICAFAELVLADDMADINRFVDAFRSTGRSVETVFLGLMTETARHLGEMWGNDSCDFCEVTLAMWRLQQLLHELSPAFQGEGGTNRGTGKRVLLSTVAAEQHTLGLSMVAEFFRRAGWEVSGDIPVSNCQLIDAAKEQWLDLVGLSINSTINFSELTETIAGIRRSSRNPAIRIMVGGWLFNQKPEMAVTVGADYMARDAREAVSMADARPRIVDEMAARRSRI